MHCKKCSTLIKPGNGWCTECGAAVEKSDSTFVCSSCGETIASGLKFCTNCGAKKPDPVEQKTQPVLPTQPETTETAHVTSPSSAPMPQTPPLSQPPPVIPPVATPHMSTPTPQSSPPLMSPTMPPPVLKPQDAKSDSKGGSNRALLIVASIIGVVVIAGIAAIIAFLANLPVSENYADTDEPKAMVIYNEVGTIRDGYEVLSGVQIFEKNRDSVIIIRTDLGNGFIGTGSGFIVCPSGVAVTNHHVMDGAVSAYAIMYDGREFQITGYYSYDVRNDLAIVHVDGRGFSFDYATIGDSDATRVGESVFAIGGPEWEPITFTPGIISRIAYDPVTFGIYTISGMLQSTAAIYQGNSGGPLVNDRGQVIGVNAAGHMIRASVQLAVPVNRVRLPATDAVVRPLPIGSGVDALPAPPQHAPGEIFYYVRYPFIPDFLSVSQQAWFMVSGTPADLGFPRGDAIHDYYDYLYAYELSAQFVDADIAAFERVLTDRGFRLQNVVEFYDYEVWTYYYHPTYDYSVSIVTWDELGDTLVVVAISQGNVYERFYGGADYEPAPAYSALVGSWSCGCTVLRYFADGTGQVDNLDDSGTVILSSGFQWESVDGVLTYITGPFEESSWEYTIINNGETVRFFGADGTIVTMDRAD